MRAEVGAKGGGRAGPRAERAVRLRGAGGGLAGLPGRVGACAAGERPLSPRRSPVRLTRTPRSAGRVPGPWQVPVGPALLTLVSAVEASLWGHVGIAGR